MSLILDALQRSEQESEYNSQAPGLHTRHDPAGSIQSGSGYLWMAVIILLLLLMLTIAGWLWWAEPFVVVEPIPVPVHVPVPDSSAVAESLTDSAPVVRLRANDSAQVAALYKQVSPEKQVEEVPPAMDIDVITKLAQAEQRLVPAAPHPTPLIADLPQRIKDQIPSIFFRKHDWSTQPADSSVHLNSGVFKVGDTVAPGLRLVEILPDSIVLDYRGEEFRLRALNSWVNL